MDNHKLKGIARNLHQMHRQIALFQKLTNKKIKLTIKELQQTSNKANQMVASGSQILRYCSNRGMDDLARMNLQKMYQSYKQTMSTLSSKMKSQLDTVKAIISSIRDSV